MYTTQQSKMEQLRETIRALAEDCNEIMNTVQDIIDDLASMEATATEVIRETVLEEMFRDPQGNTAQFFAVIEAAIHRIEGIARSSTPLIPLDAHRASKKSVEDAAFLKVVVSPCHPADKIDPCA